MKHGIGTKSKPMQISVGGDTYTGTVMMVTERDHLGRPLVMRVIHRDETIDLAELGADNPDKAPEFAIVYANHKTWSN